MGRDLEGIVVPLVTPFNADESLDEAGLRRLVAFLVEHRVHGLLPAGSQGEFLALSEEERRRCVVGIKDSSGDLGQTLDYARLTPGLRTFVGRDSLIYQAVISGCVGAVAATANVVPELVVSIYRAARAGDHARALELQRKLTPLRQAFDLGSFPVVVKDAILASTTTLCGRMLRPCSAQNHPLLASTVARRRETWASRLLALPTMQSRSWSAATWPRTPRAG